MICPCKDCEFRHIGCHAECVHYKAWREEKRVGVEASLRDNTPTDFLMDQIRKQKRYTNKHKRK